MFYRDLGLSDEIVKEQKIKFVLTFKDRRTDKVLTEILRADNVLTAFSDFCNDMFNKAEKIGAHFSSYTWRNTYRKVAETFDAWQRMIEAGEVEAVWSQTKVVEERRIQTKKRYRRHLN